MKRYYLALLLTGVSISSKAEGPDTVKVGAYVISVHDINFHDKEYTIRFWLWFLYKNNPDFNFSEQLDIPNAKSIDDPEVVADTVNGKTWVQLKMKCTMKENWVVHNFPFDKQHLRVRVENIVYDKNKLIFTADPTSTYDKVEGSDGWRIKDFVVSSDTTRYETGFGDPEPGHVSQTFATFKIDMNLEREAVGLFMKIFIGMYIAFLIALVSFVSDPWDLEPRFGLPVGGLFAAVGNKYIIDSLLPESSSFSLVDSLHSITFFGILSVLAVSAIAMKFYDENNKEKCLRIDKIGSRIVMVTFLAANIYFIATA
jgi:hypothetical protein